MNMVNALRQDRIETILEGVAKDNLSPAEAIGLLCAVGYTLLDASKAVLDVQSDAPRRVG